MGSLNVRIVGANLLFCGTRAHIEKI